MKRGTPRAAAAAEASERWERQERWGRWERWERRAAAQMAAAKAVESRLSLTLNPLALCAARSAKAKRKARRQC